MIKCNINCIESLGLKDGPGIRTVIFLQGCNLRCQYCHNPEMWNKDIHKEFFVNELMEIIKRYKPYYNKNGGITLSGGEPLLQKDFVVELFKACREEGINTCLDTAGVGLGDYEEVLSYTDLVLLDIKHINKEDYFKLVHYDINESLSFIEACNKLNKDIWIRQVIIPEINDTKEYMAELKQFLKKINNIKKIELLPYHTMAISKYKELGIPYKLEGVAPLDEEWLKQLEIELKK